MFIELPLTLIKNNPEDEIQRDKLIEMGIDISNEENEYPEVIIDVLLNMDYILRINPSEEEGGCTLWGIDEGMAFHTTLSFAEIKRKMGVK